AHPLKLRVTRIRKIPSESLGHEEAHFEVLGLLRRAERQEELGVHAHRSRFQAEAHEQRGTLADARVRAPRAATPHEPRGIARLPRVSGEVKTAPRNVRLGIPAEVLGLTVQLPDRRKLGLELERETPLHEAFLLRLVGAKQLLRVRPGPTLAHAISPQARRS